MFPATSAQKEDHLRHRVAEGVGGVRRQDQTDPKIRSCANCSPASDRSRRCFPCRRPPNVARCFCDRIVVDEIRFLMGSGAKGRLRTMFHTQVTLDKFEIVVNGKPLILDADGRTNVSIDEEVPLAHSFWIAAAIGPWHRLVRQQHSDFRHPIRST
jgi:hypothetical protein